MAWEVHHIQAMGALQVPCHGPGLSCAADSVGPSHMETGVGLSIAMEWTWAKAWLVHLLGCASGFVYVRGAGTLPWPGIVVFP